MRMTTFPIAAAVALAWSAAASAAEYEMKMLNMGPQGMFEFEPTLLRIQPGDTVHFIAKDKGHDVQSIPGMIPQGADPIKGAVSKSVTVTFAKPGVYGIRCVPHYDWGMVAMIVVGDPSSNLAQAKRVDLPAKAKAVFAKIFAAVEHQGALRSSAE